MSTRIDIKSSGGGGGSTPVGATLMKTGQTTSYRTGDDGDLEAGRATDFFTLAVNNPFGNTNRFTDELGGSTYTNDIVIDWSTYDNIGGTVLGYYKGEATNTANWNTCIDWALSLTVGSFSSWRLTNFVELCNIWDVSLTSPFNYTPFSFSGVNVWSSTSVRLSTVSAFVVQSNSVPNFAGKAGSSGRIACRTFTVTGTTLT